MTPIMCVVIFTFSILGVVVIVVLLFIVAAVVYNPVVLHGDLRSSWLQTEPL